MTWCGRSILAQPFLVKCCECGKGVSSDDALDYTFCSLECKEASENEVKVNVNENS
jgi:endogenous inhibitor of DNA gyrase (YacG/DUF329 family)